MHVYIYAYTLSISRSGGDLYNASMAHIGNFRKYRAIWVLRFPLYLQASPVTAGQIQGNRTSPVDTTVQ